MARHNFNAKSFDRIFIPQPDDHSCAAAACATVARLFDHDPSKDLAFFRRALKLDAGGTMPEEIGKVCAEHLNPVGMGCEAYIGGISIGFIRHKPTGDDRAVVFLDRQDYTFVYYDPFDHRIYNDQASNMRRAADWRDPKYTWTADFGRLPDAGFGYWLRQSRPNPYRLERQAVRQRECEGHRPQL